MNKKSIDWLYKELPGLVGKGVISGDSADKIRKHYGDVFPKGGKSTAFIVCSILGSLLIGLGIILILAHNWKDMSRSTRTVLSFLPLVTSQLIAAWVLAKRNTSIAWREGIAVFLMLSIGSSIAMISQTYHIPGDLGNFLFIWMLLSIPIVYALDASIPLVLYLWGITSWAGYSQNTGGQAVFFWLLFILALPHFIKYLKKDKFSNRSVLLGWAFALCLCIATGITLEKALPGFWIVVYAGLFSVFYLMDKVYFPEERSTGARPFGSVGSIGICVTSFLLTYKWPWKRIGWGHYRAGGKFHEYAAFADYVLAALLAGFSVFLLFKMLKRERGQQRTKYLIFGAVSLIVLAWYAAVSSGVFSLRATLFFNAYLMIMGVISIVVGIEQSKTAEVNAGMFIIAALMSARFFDSSFGFVARGVAFILIGIIFLAANIFMRGRLGQNEQK